MSPRLLQPLKGAHTNKLIFYNYNTETVVRLVRQGSSARKREATGRKQPEPGRSDPKSVGVARDRSIGS